MQLPETIDINARKEIAHLPIYNNSCHGVDILRYLLGDLHVKHIQVIKKSGLNSGRYIILEANNHTCFLSMNWNCPANFSLYIENGEEKINLFISKNKGSLI